MNRFQKLSSIALLVLAFIYPPAIVEAKENTQNHVFTEQSVDAEPNLVEGKSEELLLAHRPRYRRHYYRRRYRHHHYYRRSRHRRHYYRRRYRHGHYYGYYRHGQWHRVRDHHGRYLYDWSRY
ncbi:MULTISPECIES: hypothetical protein [Nostocales]|uniref:hypothetical protein n=1 Tax=Nostocales TaxID=1161 RepID=UPI0012FFFCB7|nr:MULTISPECIES: hypothetical protein [unclassified Nostoc]